MNRSLVFAAVGGVALAAIGVGMSIDESEDERRQRMSAADPVAWGVVARSTDGGELTECVRRPAGVAPGECLRRMPQGDVDFGELNRFPAVDAVGAGCEAVTCSVLAGEDADGPGVAP